MEDFKIEVKQLHSIGKLADKCDVQIFVVGGYVRDTLIGRETKDIDISVVGSGVDFARLVHAELNAGPPVIFEKFGTARLSFQGIEFEFVGTRKETYSPESRKPLVETGSIEDDIARRDFTVNAMAVSLNKHSFGKILDMFNGQADLDKRVLRTPLDPNTTFTDDPLRMMRAFRFSAQLGFTIAPGILDSISRLSERINIIAIERVRDEFLKILMTHKPSIGFAPLQETGIMKFIFPEFHNLAGVDQRSVDYPNGVRNFHHKDVFYHTLKVIDNLAETSQNIWLRFAALLHDIAKPKTKAFREDTGWTFHGHAELGARMTKSIFRKLKLPLEPHSFVEKMVLLHLRPIALVSEGVSDSAIRRLLFDAGEDVDALMLLCKADITSKNPRLIKKYMRNYERLLIKMQEVEQKDKLRNWQPPLDGDEIMRVCNVQPGIVVGTLKSRIENAILDGTIANKHSAAMEFLLEIKDEVIESGSMRKPVSKKHILPYLPENLS